MEILNETLVNVLTTVITGGVMVLVFGAFNYLKAKKDLIKNEDIRNIVSNTLDSIESLIKTNITNVEQVSKPIIVQAIKDGKVDKTELTKLSTEVKEKVLAQMSDDMLDILNTNIKDTDSFLSSKIEEILAQMKDDMTSNIVQHTELNK